MATPDTITNFGDVRDIALGHVLALEKGKTGETYLLGHQNVSALELAKFTMKILDIKKPVIPVPFFLARIAGYLALWFTKTISRKPPLITPEAVAISELHLAADCSKAVKELGLPQTDIKVSLTDALIWFANNGDIKNKSLLNKIARLTSSYDESHAKPEINEKAAVSKKSRKPKVKTVNNKKETAL